jgi:hypothetical protein
MASASWSNLVAAADRCEQLETDLKQERATVRKLRHAVWVLRQRLAAFQDTNETSNA